MTPELISKTLDEGMNAMSQAGNLMTRAAKEITRLRVLTEEIVAAISSLECPECGHALNYHADKYNCEVDRGDGYRIGSEILEALGPCGCECLDCPDLLPLIAILRKAKGE